MSISLETLFWFVIVLIIYVYFGYPSLLWLFNKMKHNQNIVSHFNENFKPTVSMIIAAYNEEKVIAEKLVNCLALDYPSDKLEIIVVSDGSTDCTPKIVRDSNDRKVRLVELQDNVGKAFAQNEAVKHAKGEILLFTDAEIFLKQETIQNMVRHFQDSGIGCVVGKVIYDNVGETSVSKGEGSYWRYELFVREKESDLSNLLMGSGSIIAVRQILFFPLDSAVSEDFVLPMSAAIEGYKTVFDSDVHGSLKLYQLKPHDMFKTRVRTTLLDTRSVFLCKALLNPFKYPLYAWGLISHKLLRWLIPYFLIIILITNLSLFHIPFFQIIFFLQIIFYLSALIGYLWQRRGKPPFIFGIPFSFCLVNLAALVGVAQFLMGKKSGQWEPVRS